MLILPLLAIVVFVADQLSKTWVMTHLAVNESIAPIPVLEDFFTITHIRNTGAAFGLFPELGSVFTLIAIVVSFAIVIYYRFLTADDWLVHASLGLQLGGALGNLVDRLRYGGSVTDFIYFHFFPIFNVADSMIVCGVALLVWQMFQADLRQKRAPQKVDASAPYPHSADPPDGRADSTSS
jgi:signal peptidase II